MGKITKRGSLETKEIIELVLAAAAVIVVIWLLWSLISPEFNKEQKAAEAYMSTLQEEIGKVDGGAEFGTFSLWQPKLDVRLLYFGDGIVVKVDDLTYRTGGLKKNQICFCYLKSKDWICNICSALNYPIQSKYPIFVYSDNIKITKDNSKKVYNFETA
ncbi:MAG: hypothetical protein WCP89_00750 [archaeon]